MKKFSVVENIIQKFYTNSLANHMPEFYAEELRTLVASMTPTAPGSPDRILRQMRQANKVNYIVLNRAQSFYKFLPVLGTVDLGNEVVAELTPELAVA